jgi:hypothetical protein
LETIWWKKKALQKLLGTTSRKKRASRNLWERSGGKKGPPKTFGNNFTEKKVLPKLMGTTSRKKRFSQNVWERPHGKKAPPKPFGNDPTEKKLLQNLLGTNRWRKKFFLNGLGRVNFSTGNMKTL